jgi:2,3-dihydroxybenzoate decarboxylase
MGEGIPFWLQRIDNRYRLGVEVCTNAKLARLPSEYFLENFVITTSGVMDHGALRLCLDALGVERIMFAADYPYESVEAGVAFMDATPVGEDERARIYAANAEALFGLPSVEGAAAS